MHKKDSEGLSSVQIDHMVDHALNFQQKPQGFFVEWKQQKFLYPIAISGICCLLLFSSFLMTQNHSFNQEMMQADSMHELILDDMLLSYCEEV